MIYGIFVAGAGFLAWITKLWTNRFLTHFYILLYIQSFGLIAVFGLGYLASLVGR